MPLHKFRPRRNIDSKTTGQTNGKRAKRAAAALVTWLGTDRRDADDVTHLQDLLSDLMHFADRERISFDDALDAAYGCYKDER